MDNITPKQQKIKKNVIDQKSYYISSFINETV